MVLPYLKLPFELRSSQFLLCSYRQPLTYQALTTKHSGMLHQPAVIKVSLGADSSSLKVVQCNHHSMTLPYLKLLFELRSSKLFLRSYRQPLTNQGLPTRHNRMLHQPAVIKVSLGADSSSLKVAGLLTVVQNTASAQLFVWITQWSASILSTQSFI